MYMCTLIFLTFPSHFSKCIRKSGYVHNNKENGFSFWYTFSSKAVQMTFSKACFDFSKPRFQMHLEKWLCAQHQKKYTFSSKAVQMTISKAIAIQKMIRFYTCMCAYIIYIYIYIYVCIYIYEYGY